MPSFQQQKQSEVVLSDRNTRDRTSTQPDSDLAETLELRHWEFKLTVVNMLRDDKGKLDNIQGPMGNISKDVDIPGKNQTEMLQIESPAAEMKKPSHGLISGVDTAEERMDELEDMSTETAQTKMQINNLKQ